VVARCSTFSSRLSSIPCDPSVGRSTDRPTFLGYRAVPSPRDSQGASSHVLPVLLAVLLAGVLAAPASAIDLLRAAPPQAVDLLDLSADVIMSDNVEYVGTIPIDSPGVGGQVVVRDDLDGARFFYATGAKGLSVYDITDPESPEPVAVFPFPHAQNEDVKVSDDGTRVLIAADGAIAVPVNPVTTGIHLIDVTDPASPELIASSSS
jgi:hypothetical protein